MRAEILTRELGGRWHGRYGMAKCPSHNDSTPSLSIADGDNGKLLLFCHAGCEFGAVVDALRHRGLRSDGRPDGLAAKDNRQRPASDLVRLIWSQSKPIQGTHAERYLRARGIDTGRPLHLRFHHSLRHPTSLRRPAMVGLVEHVHARAVGLHRTWLEPDAPRKTALEPGKAMLGVCKGGAVRLCGGQTGLAVCEGIETSLSLGLGLSDGTAIWAALSTSGVAGLELPARSAFSSSLLIGTDGDEPGRRAGAALADRAALLGWRVEIVAAPDGLDFNDLIGARRHG